MLYLFRNICVIICAESLAPQAFGCCPSALRAAAQLTDGTKMPLQASILACGLICAESFASQAFGCCPSALRAAAQLTDCAKMPLQASIFACGIRAGNGLHSQSVMASAALRPLPDGFTKMPMQAHIFFAAKCLLPLCGKTVYTCLKYKENGKQVRIRDSVGSAYTYTFFL